MSTLRNYCPSCEIVAVEPAALVIELGDRDDVADMSFICPSCGELITQWVNLWAVPVLRDAGCTVISASAATSAHPSGAPCGPPPAWQRLGPITDAEVDAFVSALDHPDWDELTAA